jgi:hypothetical protein
MHLKIRIVAAQFLFCEYLFRSFGIGSLQCMLNEHFPHIIQQHLRGNSTARNLIYSLIGCIKQCDELRCGLSNIQQIFTLWAVYSPYNDMDLLVLVCISRVQVTMGKLVKRKRNRQGE